MRIDLRGALGVLALLFSLAAPSAAEHVACQPPAPLRAELAQLDPELSGCDTAACRDRARQRLETLRTEYGFQMHLEANLAHLQGRDGVADRDSLRQQAEAMTVARPEDPGAWYLLASRTQGETGQTLLAEQVLARDADYPWAHWELARRARGQDPVAAAEALSRFLDQCPSQLRAVERLMRVAEPSLWQQHVDRLTAATATLPEVERIVTLPLLWQVQFAASAPDQHQALRDRIGRQVAALHALDRTDHPLWWETLASGYELVGDTARVEAVTRGRIEQFPCAKTSIPERITAWVKAANPDATEMRIKAKAVDFSAEALPELIAKVDALDAECPGQRTVQGWRFKLLQQQENVEAARVLAVTEAYLDAESAAGGMNLSLPEYQVARELIERGVALERVPDLIATARDEKPDLTKLRMPESFREQMQASHQRLDVQLARLAGTAHHRLGDTAAAKLEAERASTLYRALDPAVHGTELPELHAALAPLLAETGLAELPRPAVAETALADEASDWLDVDEPLTEMALRDLGGREWTLSDFADHGVLINFWATWCVPCVAELPEIQALHEEVETIDGLMVVTFNTDRNVGKVVPFLEQRDFTFPVVLAAGYLPPEQSSLPQNWLVDRNSVVRKKSTGFSVDGEGEWRHEVLRLLRSVADPQQP